MAFMLPIHLPRSQILAKRKWNVIDQGSGWRENGAIMYSDLATGN